MTPPAIDGAVAALLAGGVFGALGAAVVFLAVRNLARERATRKWPTVEGTIVESKLDYVALVLLTR